MEPCTRTAEERLAELEAARGELATAHAALEQRWRRAEARVRVLGGLALATLMVALFASPATRATAQLGVDPTIQFLLNKTQFITVAGGEMYIRGTNLHIENGLGATNGDPADPSNPNAAVTNGLGNLIVGYNGSRAYAYGNGPDVRTGSHNIVVGDQLNYSTYGGLLAGSLNTTSAAYACVTGGLHNIASGQYASVSGGGEIRPAETRPR
jgi:hypothetical protein